MDQNKRFHPPFWHSRVVRKRIRSIRCFFLNCCTKGDAKVRHRFHLTYSARGRAPLKNAAGHIVLFCRPGNDLKRSTIGPSLFLEHRRIFPPNQFTAFSEWEARNQIHLQPLSESIQFGGGVKCVGGLGGAFIIAIIPPSLQSHRTPYTRRSVLTP
ncbi:hypothetical protein CEXT_504621 [Caerostris extrusa]|uniref:Uncharacterized protein n=1 Tax=Caerostris extrusa TaxID=172846 RepID=A0AAV4VNW2_CAEEX|nr:hypothetical protein CEXT_504621 [Caerostris extrusa]